MKLLKNSGYTLVSNAGGGVLLLGTNLVVARYLGAESFGVYSLVLAIISFALVLSQLGMDGIVIRETAKRESRFVISSAFFLRVLASFSAMAAIVVTVKILNYPEVVYYGVIVGSFWLLMHSVVSLAWAVFQGRFEMKWYAHTHLVGRSLLFFSSLFFVYLGFDVLWLLSSYGVAGVIQLLWCGFLLKDFFSLRYVRVKEVVYVLRESLPLLFAGLFISFYYRADVLMISWWLDQAAVGYYAAVYNLTEAPVLIAVALNASLYPLFSRLAKKSMFEDVVRQGCKLVFSLAFPLAVGGMLLAPAVIHLLYRGGFDASIPVFRVLVWAGSLIMVNIILASALNALNLQKVNFFVSGVNFCLNVLLNVWAIPRFGIVGAAATTVATELFALMMLVVVLSKKSHIPFSVSEVVRVFIATLLMGAIVFIVRDVFVIIPVVLGVVSYVLFLITLGGVTKNDVLLFKKIWSGSL